MSRASYLVVSDSNVLKDIVWSAEQYPPKHAFSIGFAIQTIKDELPAYEVSQIVHAR